MGAEGEREREEMRRWCGRSVISISLSISRMLAFTNAPPDALPHGHWLYVQIVSL